MQRVLALYPWKAKDKTQDLHKAQFDPTDIPSGCRIDGIKLSFTTGTAWACWNSREKTQTLLSDHAKAKQMSCASLHTLLAIACSSAADTQQQRYGTSTCSCARAPAVRAPAVLEYQRAQIGPAAKVYTSIDIIDVGRRRACTTSSSYNRRGAHIHLHMRTHAR
jgi:hypothetical protein